MNKVKFRKNILPESQAIIARTSYAMRARTGRLPCAFKIEDDLYAFDQFAEDLLKADFKFDCKFHYPMREDFLEPFELQSKADKYWMINVDEEILQEYVREVLFIDVPRETSKERETKCLKSV